MKRQRFDFQNLWDGSTTKHLATQNTLQTTNEVLAMSHVVQATKYKRDTMALELEMVKENNRGIALQCEVKEADKFIAVVDAVKTFVVTTGTHYSDYRKFGFFLFLVGGISVKWFPIMGVAAIAIGGGMIFSSRPQNFESQIRNFGENASTFLRCSSTRTALLKSDVHGELFDNYNQIPALR